MGRYIPHRLTRDEQARLAERYRLDAKYGWTAAGIAPVRKAKCKHCGTQFYTLLPCRYCSGQCAKAVWRARAKARRLAARAAREDVTCRVCGQAFTPKRADAVYCGPSCRQKAYRQRQRVTEAELSRRRDNSAAVT